MSAPIGTRLRSGMMPTKDQLYILSVENLHLFYEVQPNECWYWNRSLRGKGYGQATHPDTRVQDYAHRVVWRMINGEIPEGGVVRHSCDNRLCINPSHLLMGTYSDNNLETWTRHPERGLRRESRRQHMMEDPHGVYAEGRAIGSPIGLLTMNGSK